MSNIGKKFRWDPVKEEIYEVVGDPVYRPRIMLKTDSMPAIRSMADGRMYDSKSRYRADLKARGLEEIGNERVDTRPREPTEAEIAQEIATAYDQVEAGHKAELPSRPPEQWRGPVTE